MSFQSICLVFLIAALGAVPHARGRFRPSGRNHLDAGFDRRGRDKRLSSVQDFTASGTITYYWAGQQVQGPATVRGRGTDQFRLDRLRLQPAGFPDL